MYTFFLCPYIHTDQNDNNIICTLTHIVYGVVCMSLDVVVVVIMMALRNSNLAVANLLLLLLQQRRDLLKEGR